jgi:putative sigma-54 modulation protein
MQIHVTGHQVEVTAPLRNYVAGKFDRIVRHFDRLHDVHVVLTIDKLKHMAEATIQASGKRIHAESDATDMYAAIDLLSDKLDRQVKKHKEKLKEHRPIAPRNGAGAAG